MFSKDIMKEREGRVVIVRIGADRISRGIEMRVCDRVVFKVSENTNAYVFISRFNDDVVNSLDILDRF
jgi:hypothetical protein